MTAAPNPQRAVSAEDRDLLREALCAHRWHEAFGIMTGRTWRHAVAEAEERGTDSAAAEQVVRFRGCVDRMIAGPLAPLLADNAALRTRAEEAERERADALGLAKEADVRAESAHDRAAELAQDVKEWRTKARNSGRSGATVRANQAERRAATTEAERDRLAEQVAVLTKALEFYANPEVYEPHPHGPAFDQRDISFVARSALHSTGGGTDHDAP